MGSIDTYCEQLDDEKSPLLLSVGNPQLLQEFVIACLSKRHISPAAKAVIDTIKKVGNDSKYSS